MTSPPAFRSSRVPASGPFLQMDIAKTAARKNGVVVVDLSIGASDLAPPAEALETLKASVDDPATHSYCLKSGTQPLLEAAVGWYGERYGLQLDPGAEALSLIGAQEGLAHALLAVADAGDAILMTEVAYPSYFGAVQVAGLQPVYMRLGPDLLPLLDAVEQADLRRAKVLLLNYPNNPTSAVASAEFFQRAIDLCRANGILLIHDNPYVDLVFGGGTSPSPLCLPGGRECVLELFSFAKSFHLGGFRLGFALGNRNAIASLEAVKGPIDFNQYKGIMRMGITCLGLPREVLLRDALVWQRRAAALVEALRREGCEVSMPTAALVSCLGGPEGTACHDVRALVSLPLAAAAAPPPGMYLWLRLPGQGADDVSFCQQLVARTGVALAPGQGFGPGGRGFVRVALVQPEEVLATCAVQIVAAMREVGLQAAVPNA
ncbi:LL-diaminopimelate aminotransferase [Tetrabaena socialis]|uniref:LL-diaminopimelate aminotransferase n=1 Tax=Tetrabaena socialis TaxID=47790 RepID=A0A2J7ZX51_9CHLO|nr:LL-diaminopimelate aminotransferase [Tetrabaena socialis]|eukprot:PNH04836.1 LL-diaminopimelate aminotransferase [Tetrabaena socialis]